MPTFGKHTLIIVVYLIDLCHDQGNYELINSPAETWLPRFSFPNEIKSHKQSHPKKEEKSKKNTQAKMAP